MSSRDAPRKGLRRLLSWRILALLPVLIGLALLVFFVMTKTGSPRRPAAERAIIVRVIPAPVADLIPRTQGYGRVRPSLTWEGTSEVTGRILDTHEMYKAGALVPAGTELVRIDPVDFELAVEEISQAIEELESQKAEIEAQRVSDQALLQIEERSLALTDQDFERQRELRDTSVVSQSVLDDAERRALAQRSVVQRLRNSLSLLPARKRSLDARIASQTARLAVARRDLGRTRVVAPFDLRITEVFAQEGAFATRGSPLATGDSTASVEVAAQFQIDKVRRLLPPGKRLPFRAEAAAPGLPDLLHLSAVVRIRDADFVVQWDARFERIEASLDPRTRTVGFIVVVDEPYEKARTGTRPVLVRGMFAEVVLSGADARPGVVLPRSALDGDHVWIADREDRMRRRQVRVDLVQGDLVLLAGGVEAGERVIVSDPVPALDGVLVDPQVDEELLAGIVAEAQGRESFR